MNMYLRLLTAMLAIGALLITACTSDEGGDEEAFSVNFSLASVPGNLTLDSLEVQIALGDTGSPQNLTIDLKTGTSKAQVMAFPGQKYQLSYRLYASGFDIGQGEAEGVLAKDMNIELSPTWNQSRIAAAQAARESGKLLPVWLESAFDKALAGKPIEIRVDSAAGHVYTWYIRIGDGTVASGQGTRISYTPPDSLGGASLNVKVVVKVGDKVIEERDWDVKILALLPADRLQAVITKADTTSAFGTYTRYKYNAEGKPDSILFYDTTAFVPGRNPVGSLAITYTQAHNPSGDPSKVVRTAVNETEIDSMFSYDSKGRLVVLTVTVKSGTTVDSLSYPSETVTVVKSHAQGKVTRVVKHVRESSAAEVDSIWSPGDSGLVLTGLIRYGLEGGKVVTKMVSRRFGTALVPFESEWTVFNALGSPAFRNYYEEGFSLLLDKTESFTYNANGQLDRILYRDEVTGEVERAEWHLYQVPSPKAAAKVSAGSIGISRLGANRSLLLRLADVGSHFPARISGIPR